MLHHYSCVIEKAKEEEKYVLGEGKERRGEEVFTFICVPGRV
jgi:hypothetical protein